MAVVSLKSFDDIGRITNTSKHAGHGRQDRAWKSLEEPLLNGLCSVEWKAGTHSMQSSPTPSKAVSLPSSLFVLTTGGTVAKAGHVFSVEVHELQKINRQVTVASEVEHGEEPSLIIVKVDREFRESPCASIDEADIAKFASHVKTPEPHLAASALEPDDEKEHPLGGYIAELSPFVEGSEPPVAINLCGQDEIVQSSHQNETDNFWHSARLEQAFRLDSKDGWEDLRLLLKSSEGVNPVEQPIDISQKISPVHHLSTNDCTEHIESTESQETLKQMPHEIDDKDEPIYALLPEVLFHSTTIKQTEETQHVSNDIEHVSWVNNVDCQEWHSYVSTAPKRTDNSKHPSSEVEDKSMQVSLHEHLQQDRTGAKEASMRNFIMHRFLPAAQEVAFMEHESSLTSLASRKQAAVVCRSLQRAQRTSTSHRIKARAYQASKGFATTHPVHTTQQADGMSHSMKSCGFFCLGLKSALFRPHRTVAASSRAVSRKKSWVSNLSSHVKVPDEESSCIKGVVQTMEASTGNSSLSRMHFSSSFHESPCRRTIKHNENVSKEHSTSVTYSSPKCNNPYSQPEKLNVQTVSRGSSSCSQAEKLHAVGNSYEQKVPTDSSLLELGGLVSNKKEENMEAFMSPGKFGHAIVHDLNNKDMSRRPLQIEDGETQAPSCLGHDRARQNGDDCDNECEFFDALSRLNSVKSTASFYTLGSPRSACDNLGLQNEWAMKDDGSEFADAFSPFETPWASLSEEKSLLVLAEHGKDINREPSSLSQRLGKVLQLETGGHLSGSSKDKCHICAHPYSGERCVLKEGDLLLEHFPQTSYKSLDSCPRVGETVGPIFPAKCQSSGSSLGWPFGISTYHSSEAEGSLDQAHLEKTAEKLMQGLDVPSPPLPPSPKGSWLVKAITKNASKFSPLTTLQQKDKVGSARRKLDFLVTSANAERRWEDVVKGSQMETGHLRFSEGTSVG